jgi:hypothetical protein
MPYALCDPPRKSGSPAPAPAGLSVVYTAPSSPCEEVLYLPSLHSLLQSNFSRDSFRLGHGKEGKNWMRRNTSGKPALRFISFAPRCIRPISCFPKEASAESDEYTSSC